MKIVVLSDTHMPKKARVFPAPLLAALADADHIIHAGDIALPSVLDMLAAFAPVTAVAGNVDPPELRAALGEARRLRLGGFWLGVCHGHGTKGTTKQRAIDRFADEQVDAIIFGHSHIPCCEYHGGVLLLNPGSPTDKRRNPYCSFGVIEAGETLAARIVYFDRAGL